MRLRRETDDSREPMTEAEMIHFNSDAVGLAELFGKLEPVVKAYAREHTRKPPDVARRLNAEGHRTASGALWTPRLVRFLLLRRSRPSPWTTRTRSRSGSPRLAG
jgi:hypothetical protein